MKPKEIKQLILELFGGQFTKDYSQKDIDRIVSQDNVYPFLYYVDKQLVAITMLYVVELFSRKIGVVEEVCTLQEYRSKGIGSSLVKKAIEQAKNLGCDFVELNVREDKPEIQKFYQNLGFYDRNNRAFRLPLKSIK